MRRTSLGLLVSALVLAALPAAGGERFTPKFEAAPGAEPGEAELLADLAARVRRLRSADAPVANPKALRFDEAGAPVKVEIGKELEGAPVEVILENPTCDGWKRAIAEAAAKVVHRTLVSKGITVASLAAEGLLPATPACPDPRLPGKYALVVRRTGVGVFTCRCYCTRHKKSVTVAVNRKAEMQRCAANVKAIKAAFKRYVQERAPAAAPDLVDLVGAGYLSAADVVCPLKGDYVVTPTVVNGKLKKLVIRCSLCSSSR